MSKNRFGIAPSKMTLLHRNSGSRFRPPRASEAETANDLDPVGGISANLANSFSSFPGSWGLDICPSVLEAVPSGFEGRSVWEPYAAARPPVK
jgi:hypothetical protein